MTVMMALQLKNGTAAYYQSAEFCRNYTSPPVSYGDSSHYLARLPGKEPHRITPFECQRSLCAEIGRGATHGHLQMVKTGKCRCCFRAVAILHLLLLLLISSFRGLHHATFWSLYRCCIGKSEAVRPSHGLLYCRRALMLPMEHQESSLL